MTPQDYLRLPYTRSVMPDDDVFLAYIPEFRGCLANGGTQAEALATLEDVAESWLTAALDRGQPIPPPHTGTIWLEGPARSKPLPSSDKPSDAELVKELNTRMAEHFDHAGMVHEAGAVRRAAEILADAQLMGRAAVCIERLAASNNTPSEKYSDLLNQLGATDA